ncbi:putative short-chain dehydrogenase [Whalleya microplaca]|nr:putative short-chain dehydrogenase [Whalleya microplaca]
MSYTKTQHTTPYAAISPTLPHLSAATKTVLIAGGASGIGAATALAFLRAGCLRLALLGRRAPLLASTSSSLRSQFPHACILPLTTDVTDVAGVDAAFSRAREEFGGGGIDVVVNATGYQARVGELVRVDLEDWWQGFEVNVKGTAVLARAVGRRVGTGRGGVVVLQLGTAGALMPANGALPMSGYAASKLAATKVMEYFGAENPGLRVITVHPGIVTETEGGQKMVKESGMEWQGDDINLPAHFLVWAASDEAAFLKNKFVFAGWDVEELKARKEEISQSPELLLGLNGFPRNV